MQKTGTAEKIVLDNIAYEVRPTGWKDANGVWGYSLVPGPGTVATVRLGAREHSREDDANAPATAH